LQGCVFNELALERMQIAPLGHAFDCFDGTALRFGAQYKTRTHNTPVHNRATGPAITSSTAFFGPHQPKAVAQNV
jgi:hypothetical protein